MPKTGVNVIWTGQPKIDKYEVTASNPQGANSNCSVEKRKTQATCAGLSPCTEYNISVRACSDKSGCGEPNILNVTTTHGRKFDYCLKSYYYAYDTINSGVIFNNAIFMLSKKYRFLHNLCKPKKFNATLYQSQ